MHMFSKEVKIDALLSKDLALRYRAMAFVDYLESLPASQLIVNFRGVRTMSRSFAHEYLTRRNGLQKTVMEINLPTNIREMFRAVEAMPKKTRLVDLKVRPTSLTL